MPEFLEQFHFIRPLWLTVVPVIAVLWWVARRSLTSIPAWQKAIPEHLAAALLINRRSKKSIYAVDLTALIILCTAFAAAGPTWSRIPNPFYSETAPLVVALSLTESMLANDIQPTRLERAKLKILDLIAARPGARTALVAYAGTAHMVLPLTEDPDLLKPFLDGLSPEIMPVDGSNAMNALELADRILTTDETPGSVLFLSDGVDAADIPQFTEYGRQEQPTPMAALIVGTGEGGTVISPDGTISGRPQDTAVDRNTLERWSRSADIELIDMTVGEQDVTQILGIVASNLERASDEETDSAWNDRAWLLIWPALLLSLLSFRKGWTMAW